MAELGWGSRQTADRWGETRTIPGGISSGPDSSTSTFQEAPGQEGAGIVDQLPQVGFTWAPDERKHRKDVAKRVQIHLMSASIF